MEQTAVEWLIKRYHDYGTLYYEDMTKAKEMEKEQIVNFCFECLRGDNIHTIKNNKELFEYIEQYYNETFNTNN